MEALPFLERAGDSRVIPRVVPRLKTVRQVLRRKSCGRSIQVSSGSRPAGLARLSAYTNARADGTRTRGSSALNVKLLSSFTKWNK
jgi:hypothetical protein